MKQRENAAGERGTKLESDKVKAGIITIWELRFPQKQQQHYAQITRVTCEQAKRSLLVVVRVRKGFGYRQKVCIETRSNGEEADADHEDVAGNLEHSLPVGEETLPVVPESDHLEDRWIHQGTQGATRHSDEGDHDLESWNENRHQVGDEHPEDAKALVHDKLRYIREAIREFPTEAVEEHVEDDVHRNRMSKRRLEHKEDVDCGEETLLRQVLRDCRLNRVSEGGVAIEAKSRHESRAHGHRCL